MTNKQKITKALELLNEADSLLSEVLAGEEHSEEIFCPLGEVISNVEGIREQKSVI